MSRAKIVEPLGARVKRRYRDEEGTVKEAYVTVDSLVTARVRRSKKKVVVRLRRGVQL